MMLFFQYPTANKECPITKGEDSPATVDSADCVLSFIIGYSLLAVGYSAFE
jgi:hypothetical protein